MTINSDDPAYFGGYVADNYLALQRELGLDLATLEALARDSLAASFAGATDLDHQQESTRWSRRALDRLAVLCEPAAQAKHQLKL